MQGQGEVEQAAHLLCLMMGQKSNSEPLAVEDDIVKDETSGSICDICCDVKGSLTACCLHLLCATCASKCSQCPWCKNKLRDLIPPDYQFQIPKRFGPWKRHERVAQLLSTRPVVRQKLAQVPLPHNDSRIAIREYINALYDTLLREVQTMTHLSSEELEALRNLNDVHPYKKGVKRMQESMSLFAPSGKVPICKVVCKKCGRSKPGRRSDNDGSSSYTCQKCERERLRSYAYETRTSSAHLYALQRSEYGEDDNIAFRAAINRSRRVT